MPDLRDLSALPDEELVELFRGTGTSKRARSVGAHAQHAHRDGLEHAVFTAIVERYQKRIYFAVRKMVHGEHDLADEITQETFVKAYEALPAFRGESKLHTWLYRIALNTVIQRGRMRKVRQMVGLETIEATAVAEAPAPDGAMVQSETTALIEAAIKTLPAKQQRVFLMRFYEELSYEEISQITGTSVGGLKANYFHAVRKIADHVKAAERTLQPGMANSGPNGQ